MNGVVAQWGGAVCSVLEVSPLLDCSVSYIRQMRVPGKGHAGRPYAILAFGKFLCEYRFRTVSRTWLHFLAKNEISYSHMIT